MAVVQAGGYEGMDEGLGYRAGERRQESGNGG